MNWYLKAWKNYANFAGRARRKEYWMFILFNLLFAILAFGIDIFFGFANNHELYGRYNIYGPVYNCYALTALIPGLAVTVRRLHDTGNSGWMILVSLIPIVGTIWILVLLLTDSNAGSNRYGDNPKAVLAWE